MIIHNCNNKLSKVAKNCPKLAENDQYSFKIAPKMPFFNKIKNRPIRPAVNKS
jgi:hypothetical protein